jgi:hypothetical protein
LSIHVELVALRLAAKDRMIFQHPARSLRPGSPPIEERRRKTADAATYNYAIK